jgi:hypothetical protein
VPVRHGRVQVLEQPDALVATRSGAAESGELDEVELVRNRNRPREVGDEEQRPVQRRDEDRLGARVVAADLGAELRHSRLDLLGREIRGADADRFG